MALLRLQICVQPREVQSSLAQGPPEPTHKWLQVCREDLTIQGLAEQLEARFHARSHALLNIKILKFLDDLELDPSQKVGEIFEDIRTGDRFSTVKVYRNPPTPAELADTKRFESLPPDSAARPRKRPLPPLFADATRNERFSVINGPTWQPAQATDCLNEANKRRRVQNVDTDAERPLASQEVERSYGDALPVAGRGQSQINQVDEFRKPSHKKRCNPYGTPLSTQISSQDQHESEEERVISVPDSPYDNGVFQPPEESIRAKSESPEIPSSVYDLPPSQGLVPDSMHIQTPTDDTFLNHAMKADGRTIPATPAPKLLSHHIIISDQRRSKSQSDHPTTRTTSQKHGSSFDKPGRSKRPSVVTAPTPFKPTGKIVFDPIETSEESSQEPSKLSTYKRPKMDYANKGSLEVTSNKNSPHRSSQTSHLTHTVSQPWPGAPSFQAPPEHTTGSGENLNADKLAPRESLSARKHLGGVDTMPTSAKQQDANVTQNNDFGRHDSSETQSEPKLSLVDAFPTDQESPSYIVEDGHHAKGTHDLEAGQDSVVSSHVASCATEPDFSPLESSGELHVHQREEDKRRARAELEKLLAQSNEQKEKKRTGAAQSPENEAATGQHAESSITADDLERRREGQTIEEDRRFHLRHSAPERNHLIKDLLSKGSAQVQAHKRERAEEEATQKQQRRKEEQQLRKQTKGSENARITKMQRTEEQRVAEKRRVSLAEEAEKMEHQEQAEEQAAKVAEAEETRRREEIAEQKRIEAKKDAREEEKQQELKAEEEARLAQERAKKRRDEANARRKAKTEASEKLEKEKEQAKQDKRESERTAEEKVRKEKGHLAQVENSRVEKDKTISDRRATLAEKTVKARINAQKQLKIANEELKQKQLDSFQNGTSKSKTASTSNEKPQRRESKGPKKGLSEPGQTVEKRKVPDRSFTDLNALRAAGIISAPPTPFSKGTPATVRKEASQIRSFTPVMPSSSIKSKKEASDASQTPTAKSYLTKTPVRSALRSNVLGSHRSVSFVDGKPSTSQQSNSLVAPKVSALKDNEIVLSSGSEASTLYSDETESSASGTASDSKQANKQLQRESSQATAGRLRLAKASYPTLSSLREAQSTRLEVKPTKPASRAESESSSSDSDSDTSSSDSESNSGPRVKKNPKNPFEKLSYPPKR